MLEILLVEDNPGDVRLIGEVFGEENVHVVNDGAAALDYLNNRSSFSDALPPDLILLDLNLPKQSGREVLQIVKDDPSLRHIPVIILTTSATEEEICEAYRHRASCYVVKPFDLSDYMRVLESIRQFWTTTVRLAPRTIYEGRSGTHLAWQTPSPVGAHDE